MLVSKVSFIFVCSVLLHHHFSSLRTSHPHLALNVGLPSFALFILLCPSELNFLNVNNQELVCLSERYWWKMCSRLFPLIRFVITFPFLPPEAFGPARIVLPPEAWVKPSLLRKTALLKVWRFRPESCYTNAQNCTCLWGRTAHVTWVIPAGHLKCRNH